MKKISGVDKRHIFKNFFKRINEPYDLRVRNAIDGEEMLHIKLTKKSVFMLISTFLVISFLLVSILFLFTPIKYYIPGYETIDSRKKVVLLSKRLDSMSQFQKNSAQLMRSALRVLDTVTQTIDTNRLNDRAISTAEMSNIQEIENKNKRAKRQIESTERKENYDSSITY
jgi:hypothetical protein